MKKDTDKQTLVEEGTEFTGTMRARCKVVVRGSMDGELEAPAVEVAEGGTMTGSVKAKSVHARGILAGSVEADEISLAGVVRSNTVIRAKTLSVNLASEEGRLEVTFGDTVLEVGEMPSAHATDAETAASGSRETANEDEAPRPATREITSAQASEAELDDAGGRKKTRKTDAESTTPSTEADTLPASAPG
jgi:cytoskeletal protein CcmA (bactofilin family)